jgi:hypothetical protein
MVFTNAKHIETNLVRQFHLRQQILHPLNRLQRNTRQRVGNRRRKAVNTKLHELAPKQIITP